MIPNSYRKRQRVPHRHTSATRLSSTATVVNSFSDKTVSESSQKLHRTSSAASTITTSPSAVTSSFNDPYTADVLLRLFVDRSPFDSDAPSDSSRQSDIQIYLHSAVIRRAKYFAAILSDCWQHRTNADAKSNNGAEGSRSNDNNNNLVHLNLAVVDDPNSISIHLTVLQLLYTSDFATVIDSASTALEILPVALELLFEDCVKSCLRFLEAVPWSEEEEKRVLSLIPFLREEESKELLARLSPGKEDSCEEMLHGLILAAIHNHPNMAFVKAFVAKLLRDFSSRESARRVLERAFETSLKVVKESLEEYTSPDFRGDHNETEAARGSRIDYCGSEANPLHFGNAGTWMNTPLGEHSQQWGAELGFLASKSSVELGAAASDATTHGLSLSLSSHPTPKNFGADPVQFTGNQYGSDGFHSKPGEFKELLDSKTSNLGHFFSMQKSSSTSKADGKSLQDAGGTSAYVHRQTIPLGPFTGYATILKNSRFLKPAQELLDEFCHLSNSKPVKVCDTSEGIPGEVSACKESNSGASATFYSSNESCKDEYQQKKAKLVYMHEEVCRRYKLYHQQMQMVVSSFESVAGLGAATPYVPLALKTVARDFRCLRNAILDQIKHVSRALGEDLLSPTTGTSGCKGDINMSRLKCFGQKSGGVNMGFLEPQQHSWRPQRGLPERSVAILRAWLFEHFLHPYPTDTDKHMLATQTGLSRNQVSNWFINARVRVWKPMVEEIHMLESKCLAEGNQNSSKSEGKSTSEGRISWPNDGQSINRSCVNALSDKQLACADMLVADAHDLEHWNHEKRSSMDFHIPTSMEGSLMGFAPYQQSRLENGGLGAVSLTLGLMHGVESAQQQQRQQQQQYQQERHSRRQFGGHLIHDLAG